MGLAFTALAPSGAYRADGSTPASLVSQGGEQGLTPAQSQEMEARFAEAMRRYGDRLLDEQRKRLRRVLVENERMLAGVRDFALENGDPPAPVLKLVAEGAGAPISSGRSGSKRMTKHAR